MKYLVLILTIIVFNSCQTQKKVIEKIVTKDSLIYVTKYKTDSIKIIERDTITVPFNNYIQIDCDSTKFEQTLNTGKSNLNIKKEKGKVFINYNQEILVNKYKSLYEQSLIKIDSISKIKNTSLESTKTIIKETFWQSLLSNIWKLLFFIVFILWIFNITPINILLKLFPQLNLFFRKN